MTREQINARELAKADDAIRVARRQLAVAQRAKILVEGAIATGEMVLPQYGGGRVVQRARFPYIFGQAYSMADRLTE